MRPAAATLAPTLSTWLVLAVAGAYPIDNADTFGHLALGRQIAQLGHVPSHDSFSYFRPSPARFVNYEWLSDWIFYAWYRSGGADGLQLLKLCVSGLLAYLLVRSVQLRAAPGAAWLVPWLALLGLPGLRFRWSVRPHLFGTLLGALYLLGLGRLLGTHSARERRAWIMGLAAAHVLWVNLHGSHLLGLAFTALACLCCVREPARLRPLGALFGLMLLGSCVSPYGPSIVSDALAHSFDPRYRTWIEEWRPWQPSQSLWYPASYGLVVVLLGLSWNAVPPGRQPARWLDLLTAALLLLMAARSLRFLSDAVALSIPALAVGLAPRWLALGAPRRTLTAALGGAGALGFAIAGCLALPPQASFGLGISSRGRPEASAQWLNAHWPNARVLAAMEDAWDLMFSLPHARFLLDGRAPFYGPDHIARVQRAWGSPALLRELLDSTRTEVVIVQPALKEQQPALHALLGAADFVLVAIEAEHCVFARARPALAPLALRVLQPGYDTRWLTAPALDAARVQSELARLPRHPNTRAYEAWVRALLRLRPLLRDAGGAGLRAPHDAAERMQLTAALDELRESHAELPLVQTVAVYHALAATLACQLDEARAALAQAQQLGAVREILLGAQELALRDGQTQSVRRFLEQAGTLPEAEHDSWLAALRDELNAPPSCRP